MSPDQESSSVIAALSVPDTVAEKRVFDPARPGMLRLVAWLMLLVVAGVYAVAVASPVRGFARFALLEVIYCVPVSATVALSWLAFRGVERVERRFWLLLGGANAFLLACEVLLVAWVVAINPAGPPRVSWPFHILHAGAAVAFLALVLSMTRYGSAENISRARFIADFAVGGVVCYVALLYFYARPVMSSVGAPIGHVLLGAMYPLTSVLLLAGTLVNLVGLKVFKWRPWERLVAIALPVYAAAISLWPWWYTTVSDTSRNLTRGWLDLVQMAAHWVLMMAVVYRLTQQEEGHLRPLPPVSLARYRWSSWLVPGSALVVLPFMASAAFGARTDPRWFAVYSAAVIVLAALLVARGMLTSLEHTALFHRSVTDPLTGLYNHRFFHDHLAEEVDRADRWHDDVSLIMIDLDDFGRLNQTLGHREADRVLAGLGAKLAEAVGPQDVVARLGGDDFAVVMPEMDGRSATVMAQRLLDVLGIEGGARPGQMSASAGVASYPGDARSADDLIRLAEGALFRAKEMGKRRVVLYEEGRVPDLSARERIERIEKQSRLSSVRGLAAAVDARDSATQDHSVKVSALARLVCEQMGMSEERTRMVEIAGLVHDVGKIGLSDVSLAKRGPLSDAEWAEVRQHPALGQRILAATQLDELLPWVRGHHERVDGTGYPDGLMGDEIPLEARILCVCDAWDAMTSVRPYRAARSRLDAIAELRNNTGSQFDAFAVSALLAALERRGDV